MTNAQQHPSKAPPPPAADNPRTATAQAIRASLLAMDQARPARVTIVSVPSVCEVRFDFPGSFTGTVDVLAPDNLVLTYVVSDMNDRLETVVFRNAVDLLSFLGRMIRVIRHYSLPNLNRFAV